MPPGEFRWVLGLDEAGRGSLLGPLVVGGFAVPASEGIDAELRGLGTKDSKALSARRREEVFEGLCRRGTLLAAWADPPEVDRWVRGPGLNALEVALMGGLIRRCSPGLVLADACDVDADRFARHLRRQLPPSFPRVRIVARHKADRDLPLVSAASIVAKVTRDRRMVQLARTLGEEMGTGYPSDPRTRRHLEDLLARHRDLPPHVRRTWATVTRVSRSLHPGEPLERWGGSGPSPAGAPEDEGL